MARIPGVSGGQSPITLMVVGIMGGIIADMLWYSLGLPGYNVPLQGCQTLTMGDAIQIGGTGGLTAVGFLTGSKALPAFTFGLMLGGLFPKVLTKAIGIPRYGIFDIDTATGQVSPLATLRGLTGGPVAGGQRGADVGGRSVAPTPPKTQQVAGGGQDFIQRLG
jgi:hypothetical protein